jgi:hypothetical protein
VAVVLQGEEGEQRAEYNQSAQREQRDELIGAALALIDAELLCHVLDPLITNAGVERQIGPDFGTVS